MPCCAARPKEQKRHSKKCAEITTQLGSFVEQYNVLLPHGSKPRPPAQLEDIKRHTFAWAAEYRHLDGEEPAGVFGGYRLGCIGMHAFNAANPLQERHVLCNGL